LPKADTKKPGVRHGFQPGNKLGKKWVKGQSGNPAGYPKDKAETAAYIEKRLREEFVDQWIDALKYHAVKGSAPLMVEAGARMAGRVTDKLELTGKDGAPVSVDVHERRSKAFGEYVDRLRLKAKGEDNGGDKGNLES
jgi:hypothetical protein